MRLTIELPDDFKEMTCGVCFNNFDCNNYSKCPIIKALNDDYNIKNSLCKPCTNQYEYICDYGSDMCNISMDKEKK